MDHINKIKYYLTIAIFFWLIGSLAIILIPKGEISLFVNQYHHSFLDKLFIGATWVGEIWITLAIVFGLILFYNIHTGIGIGIIMALTGLIIQGLKRLVFTDHMRPGAFFGEEAGIHYIEGLEIHTMYSFPSGHTTAAFTLFTLLALLAKQKKWQFALFFTALMVGFSRIYLIQHFFIDIYAGSMLGISLAIVSFYVFNKYFPAKEGSVINKPLIRLEKKNDHTAQEIY
ncbi:phosphatase PAP2 family protein [Cytophagaceae bacterium ABcell3]|nr:phosphatase PAP2 family protein [Cytophagaceae bacterium ABcell3]